MYGVTGKDPENVHVYPGGGPRGGLLVNELDGREVIAVIDRANDVAVYEAPPSPVERDDGDLIDNDGRQWTVPVMHSSAAESDTNE